MLFFFQRERERVQIAGLGCRSLGRGRVRSLGGGGAGGEGEGVEGGEGVGEGRPSSASSTHTRLPIWSGAPRGDFLPLSKQQSCAQCQHLAVIEPDTIAFGVVFGCIYHPLTFF